WSAMVTPPSSPPRGRGVRARETAAPPASGGRARPSPGDNGRRPGRLRPPGPADSGRGKTAPTGHSDIVVGRRKENKRENPHAKSHRTGEVPVQAGGPAAG